jgi:hypothetical protein
MVSLREGNPNQLFVYSMEVNIYIGFWTLKPKCTQYGLYGRNVTLDAVFRDGSELPSKLSAGVGRGENHASSLARRSRLILPYMGFSVLRFWWIKCGYLASWGISIGVWLLSSFLLFRTRYVRYFMVIWCKCFKNIPTSRGDILSFSWALSDFFCVWLIVPMLRPY